MRKEPIEWIENWEPALAANLDTPCWDCTSKYIVRGYPSLRRDGVFTKVHRYLYQELFGVLPREIMVRHKCDNRLCINPEHLEPGTLEDLIGLRSDNKDIPDTIGWEVKWFTAKTSLITLFQ